MQRNTFPVPPMVKATVLLLKKNLRLFSAPNWIRIFAMSSMHCKTLDQTPSARNSLQNQYGGVMAIFHDATYYAAKGGQNSRLLIHTGARIPSNIISEVDRKLDDGIANTGDFRFNSYDAGGSQPAVGNCLTTSQASQVDVVSIQKQTLGIATPMLLHRWNKTVAVPLPSNCRYIGVV